LETWIYMSHSYDYNDGFYLTVLNILQIHQVKRGP